MAYKKIGTIDNISQIPFNKNLIVTGRMGNGWSWHMPGVFKKQGNKIVFRNVHEMSTEIDKNTIIGLNILEEI
ncbi:hypothetical protein ACFP7A_00885 [Sporolactobacillus kofuensis]|uniref:Uncharacterized protein n=1 Tax=Sporolactobacillus kofuensis TaxID=269672 RepID=A0ABW1WC27_9BACL|nr:hypothetical protein [Sporolactobacillus kofuensis]MCO7175542.1 hypothetical protein [Sporolactobacillus kofuensis]